MKRVSVKKPERGLDYLDRCSIKIKTYIQGSRLDGTILDIMPLEGGFSLSEHSDKGCGSRYVVKFSLRDRNGEEKAYDKDEFSLDIGDAIPESKTPQHLNHRMVAELRDWMFISRNYSVKENVNENGASFMIMDKDAAMTADMQAKPAAAKYPKGEQLSLFLE